MRIANIIPLLVAASLALAAPPPSAVYSLTLEKGAAGGGDLAVRVVTTQGAVTEGRAGDAAADVAGVTVDATGLRGDVKIGADVWTLDATIQGETVSGKWRGTVGGVALNGTLTGACRARDALPAGDGGGWYLRAVRDYADCLLRNGRDNYGPQSSPLIAALMDRKTLKPLVADDNWAARWKGNEFTVQGIRIRPQDRMPWGANPMHDQSLYQVLYALARETGDPAYAREADRTLQWFFDHCQSENTGLMPWGEHLGWNFRTEKFDGGLMHEFFRPWLLWDACYRVSPDACVRFARGLRLHQVQPDGNYSRHAPYSKHGPGANSNFPRHGGYYIATWARAYAYTKDEFFTRAIAVQLAFHRGSKVDRGIIPCASNKGYTEYWPPSLLSMAISVHEGAQYVPEPLAKDMLAFAKGIDAMLALSPDSFRAERMDAKDLSVKTATTGHWGGSGYGENSLAQMALVCRERYLQCKEERYRKAFLSVADELLTAALPAPGDGKTWEPGGVGAGILALLHAYGDTGDAKYLARPKEGAEAARALFFDAGNPLPKVTSTGAHYESITRADTLMMALLQLHIATSTGKLSEELRFNDR